LSTYVPFQREGRHLQQEEDFDWMLATQLAGGQAGELRSRGSNFSSVTNDSRRWDTASGISPKTFVHVEVRKAMRWSISASGMAGKRALIQWDAVWKLAR
jgi:hypothetical protein